MTEALKVTGILQDISLLYELSLSVGQSLELDENCDAFLRTLLARKNLHLASVWVRQRYIAANDESGGGLMQVYANPSFRAPVHVLAADHPLVARVQAETSFSLSHGEVGFAEIVSETGIDQGTFAVYRLGDIGLLKLYTSARSFPFTKVELSKLRHVVDKFTVSLEGCLDHARVRAAEQRRREIELKMLHTQKLESLGLLAGGVAHDFNNLLTAIQGNAELARPAVAKNATARECLDNIVGAAARAADLSSQLLAYSGRGRFVIGPVDLNGVIEEMLRLTAVTVSKKARMQRSLTRLLPSLEGDPTQIRQVVMNLVTNASEALGDSCGDVRVATGTVRVTAADLAEFHLGDQREPGEYVYLDIADTGCGMDEKTMLKIFDPFFTTRFTGRGLGLAAVLGIVRGHHGAIRVRSVLGRGTEVRVLFPASLVAVRPAPREPEVPQGRWGNGLVLVVDDEEAVRALFGKLLSQLGFDVINAADGGQALRLYAARRSEILLVLLDLTMPVLGGDEVFEGIVRMNPDARVVLTSGYSEFEISARFENQGPSAFLQKPFRIEDLSRVIHNTLAGPRDWTPRRRAGPMVEEASR